MSIVLDSRSPPTVTSRRERRKAMLRLARRVGSESDPRAVMAALLEEAERLVNATSGFVGRWDEAQQQLVDLLGSRLAKGGMPFSVKPGEGAAGRIALERAPVIVDDYQHLPLALPDVLRLGVLAAVGVPLLHEGRLLGVLVCTTDDPAKRFTNDDAEVLVMLGSVAAATLVQLEHARTAEQLRLLTDQLEQVIEATSDAIVISDARLELLGWNEGAERLYGWTRAEVLGRSLPNLTDDGRTETLRLWQSVLDSGQCVAAVEQVRLTRDGRRVPTLATLSPMRDADGATIGVLEIAKDLTALKMLEEQQRRLSRAEERETIAMDLHDNALQALHGAVLLLSAVERQTDADIDEVRAAAKLVRNQLTSAIQQLRARLFETPAVPAARLGLTGGLMTLIQQVCANVRAKVDVEVEPSLDYWMSSEQAEHLLAIANEAMFNAVRHARASRLRVVLTNTGRGLALSISDDGVGFDASRPRRFSAQGLKNMAARTRMLRGHFLVLSRPGGGTEVRVEVPLAAQSNGRT